MKNQISKQLAYLTFTLTLIITIVAIFIPKIVDAAPNYKWGDKNHDSLTGPTGTKYSSLGYACLIIFKNDGTLDESRGAYPESSDKDIQVSYSNEAFSGVSTVPSCKDGKPANYVWVASDKRSTIVVSGNQDNKLVGVGSPYRGEAKLWQIQSDGTPTNAEAISKIDKPDQNEPPETDQTKKGVQDAVSTDKSTEEQCSQALSPFGWVLCPATNFADNLYSLFKQLVNNLLFFESDKYNDNGLKDSWKIMVTLANTVLVLVAIVIIAAQIFNFEFISAYTVKKALPRVVVAAILIQLSWFMVTTGIQLVNAIGSGIYWLLVAPFTQNIAPGDSGGVLEIGPILAQGGANGSEVANAGMFVFASGALATGALLAFASGLWMTMVVAAIGVVISILVAIVTLILREALLIVLIALAPLAIAFWILPGTNGLWNMWWKTFSRLLLMYPLIMLLFAGGTISAILLASAGDNINKIFAIVAYFIPVFLISTTYKFAGGAFASMANFINKSGGAIGGKIKSGNLGGLKKVAENQKASREYNRQEQGIRNIERGGFRGRIGRLQAGTAGAHGSYSSILRAQEEKKAYENASFAYGQATKGMDFPDQVDDSLTIASARSGETITLSNGQQLTVSESTQKVAAKFLADTGRSDQIRQLEHNLRQDNRVELWNTIAAENASAITKMNPDQMGKAFDTLSAAEISDVKPGTMRNIRAMMADGNVDQRRKDRVMAQVNELYNNETLRSKLGAESLGHVEEMITSPNLTRETSVIIDGQNQRHVENIDRFGQTQHIIDNNGNRVANPNFTQDNGW